MADPVQQNNHEDLERTLSLPAALAIGVGTMVGAGIFVFPGIAAGDAGAGAMLSFALAGGIALLVALATAELATAMPKSGGAYFFISRTFGPRLGMVVGIGQWFGLVFASAFYLTGFAEYAVRLLSEFGYALDDPPVLIGLAAALLLTMVNLLGTRGAGRLQNYVVISLVAILTLLLLYGALQAIGVFGALRLPAPFAPSGWAVVFPTTALIFTSYLGFVQIATVAGEIKAPHRNLPRALIGSVLIVGTLYILALFVSTSLLPKERLAELGETAMVEVARRLAGNVGALAILAAGLLATLSSANASILSSSRAVYALGRDGLLPPVISRIHSRFGTPHIALLAVGLPIAGLLLLRRIEVLAEVASLLHLVFYGLICITLLVLRRRAPLWYAPTFYVPAAPLVGGVGALASFGLIALMAPLSLAIGGAVLLLALGWHLLYARRVELSSPEPSHIIPAMRRPSILLPIEMPHPGHPPFELLRAFQHFDLFVLGIRELPEQTSPQQAREQSGGEEEKTLQRYKRQLEQQGIQAESQLIFTPEKTETIEHYLQDLNCQALLLTRGSTLFQRLLVPVHSSQGIHVGLATMLRELAQSSRLPVRTLILKNGKAVGEGEKNPDALASESLRQLERSGLPAGQLEIDTKEVDEMEEAIPLLADEGDLLVLGAPRHSDRRVFFRRLDKQLRAKSDYPILVVLPWAGR